MPRPNTFSISLLDLPRAPSHLGMHALTIGEELGAVLAQSEADQRDPSVDSRDSEREVTGSPQVGLASTVASSASAKPAGEAWRCIEELRRGEGGPRGDGAGRAGFSLAQRSELQRPLGAWTPRPCNTPAHHSVSTTEVSFEGCS